MNRSAIQAVGFKPIQTALVIPIVLLSASIAQAQVTHGEGTYFNHFGRPSTAFYDGTFDPLEWHVTRFSTNNGSNPHIATVNFVTPTDGNEYISVNIDLNGPPHPDQTPRSQLVMFENKLSTFDPRLGAIRKLDFLLEAAPTGNPTTGALVIFPMLFQDDSAGNKTAYRAIRLRAVAGGGGFWETGGFTNIPNTDWQGVRSALDTPDFSVTGKPITFGFGVGVSGQAQFPNNSAKFDNWMMKVNLK